MLTCRRTGCPAADPEFYCAAAAVVVLRKAGITSFAKRSIVERGGADDAIEAGITLFDRLQGLDDVLRPAGEEPPAFTARSILSGSRSITSSRALTSSPGRKPIRNSPSR